MLISSMIGIGYLTLSASMRIVGVINGLVVIILCALAAMFGGFMIT